VTTLKPAGNEREWRLWPFPRSVAQSHFQTGKVKYIPGALLKDKPGAARMSSQYHRRMTRMM
jgi:hypothetical protein